MYTFDQILPPVWDTDIIYDESLTFIKEGEKVQAPLMFEPAEIISVTSADKTVTYEEGKDYTVEGNLITLTEHSRMFFFHAEEMIFDKQYPESVLLPVTDVFPCFPKDLSSTTDKLYCTVTAFLPDIMPAAKR